MRPTLEERGKAGARRERDPFHGTASGGRGETAGRPSGAAPEESAQPTQEAAGPGQDDASGEGLQEVLGPQAPRLVADPDLAGPLRGLHGQCPRPP